MYQNPVIRGMNPDPSICRSGEDYYLATSTMFLYPGVPIHHSRDLIHWRLIGHCLTRAAHFQPEATKNGAPMIYAPTLRCSDGVFYMITTNVHGGGNFYVTATDPAGPWSDPIVVDQDVFDPSLMFDGEKAYYSRRGAMHDKDVLQAEIDIKTGKLLTPLRSIGVGMVSDDAEGPHLYHIGDWYYLLLAEGGSRFLHMATIGRSRSPWGPFEPCPHNPIIAQHEAWWHPVRSIGHADLVEAHDGSWWAVYLGTRHANYDALSLLGRETFLAPVEWKDGWPVVNKQAQRALTVDAPTLALHPWEVLPARDDFDAQTLRLDWTWLTVPDADLYSLTERPGFLRLRGKPTLLHEGRQAAFAGWRQADLYCEASALLEFAPQGENEEAGLCVFHQHDFHYDLFRTVRQGQPVLALRKVVGDIKFEADAVPVPEGPLRLRVTADPHRYTFSYAVGTDDWREAGSGLTRFLTAELAGSWNGNLLGIYSSGNGTDCKEPADFDWFEYRTLETTTAS